MSHRENRHFLTGMVPGLALVAGLFCGSILPAAEPQVEDVAFRAAADGSEQRYVRILPADYDRHQACNLLIALHGHGSDRWQFARHWQRAQRACVAVAARHG